ncbi:mucin-17-like [Branchiostoma lanceolatum]|uniref:mucin-17-like n=1 Tax=Branchiostoma lanceolatum TaxID=7740 RepID=UPI003455ABD8
MTIIDKKLDESSSVSCTSSGTGLNTTLSVTRPSPAQSNTEEVSKYAEELSKDPTVLRSANSIGKLLKGGSKNNVTAIFAKNLIESATEDLQIEIGSCSSMSSGSCESGMNMMDSVVTITGLIHAEKNRIKGERSRDTTEAHRRESAHELVHRRDSKGATTEPLRKGYSMTALSDSRQVRTGVEKTKKILRQKLIYNAGQELASPKKEKSKIITKTGAWTMKNRLAFMKGDAPKTKKQQEEEKLQKLAKIYTSNVVKNATKRHSRHSKVNLSRQGEAEEEPTIFSGKKNSTIYFGGITKIGDTPQVNEEDKLDIAVGRAPAGDQAPVTSPKPDALLKPSEQTNSPPTGKESTSKPDNLGGKSVSSSVTREAKEAEAGHAQRQIGPSREGARVDATAVADSGAVVHHSADDRVKAAVQKLMLNVTEGVMARHPNLRIVNRAVSIVDPVMQATELFNPTLLGELIHQVNHTYSSREAATLGLTQFFAATMSGVLTKVAGLMPLIGATEEGGLPVLPTNAPVDTTDTAASTGNRLLMVTRASPPPSASGVTDQKCTEEKSLIGPPPLPGCLPGGDKPTQTAPVVCTTQTAEVGQRAAVSAREQDDTEIATTAMTMEAQLTVPPAPPPLPPPDYYLSGGDESDDETPREQAPQQQAAKVFLPLKYVDRFQSQGFRHVEFHPSPRSSAASSVAGSEVGSVQSSRASTPAGTPRSSSPVGMDRTNQVVNSTALATALCDVVENGDAPRDSFAFQLQSQLTKLKHCITTRRKTYTGETEDKAETSCTVATVQADRVPSLPPLAIPSPTPTMGLLSHQGAEPTAPPLLQLDGLGGLTSHGLSGGTAMRHTSASAKVTQKTTLKKGDESVENIAEASQAMASTEDVNVPAPPLLPTAEQLRVQSLPQVAPHLLMHGAGFGRVPTPPSLPRTELLMSGISDGPGRVPNPPAPPPMEFLTSGISGFPEQEVSQASPRPLLDLVGTGAMQPVPDPNRQYTVMSVHATKGSNLSQKKTVTRPEEGKGDSTTEEFETKSAALHTDIPEPPPLPALKYSVPKPYVRHETTFEHEIAQKAKRFYYRRELSIQLRQERKDLTDFLLQLEENEPKFSPKEREELKAKTNQEIDQIDTCISKLLMTTSLRNLVEDTGTKCSDESLEPGEIVWSTDELPTTEQNQLLLCPDTDHGEDTGSECSDESLEPGEIIVQTAPASIKSDSQLSVYLERQSSDELPTTEQNQLLLCPDTDHGEDTEPECSDESLAIEPGETSDEWPTTEQNQLSLCPDTDHGEDAGSEYSNGSLEPGEIIVQTAPGSIKSDSQLSVYLECQSETKSAALYTDIPEPPLLPALKYSVPKPYVRHETTFEHEIAQKAKRFYYRRELSIQLRQERKDLTDFLLQLEENEPKFSPKEREELKAKTNQEIDQIDTCISKLLMTTSLRNLVEDTGSKCSDESLEPGEIVWSTDEFHTAPGSIKSDSQLSAYLGCQSSDELPTTEQNELSLCPDTDHGENTGSECSDESLESGEIIVQTAPGSIKSDSQLSVYLGCQSSDELPTTEQNQLSLCPDTDHGENTGSECSDESLESGEIIVQTAPASMESDSQLSVYLGCQSSDELPTTEQNQLSLCPDTDHGENTGSECSDESLESGEIIVQTAPASMESDSQLSVYLGRQSSDELPKTEQNQLSLCPDTDHGESAWFECDNNYHVVHGENTPCCMTDHAHRWTYTPTRFTCESCDVSLLMKYHLETDSEEEEGEKKDEHDKVPVPICHRKEPGHDHNWTYDPPRMKCKPCHVKMVMKMRLESDDEDEDPVRRSVPIHHRVPRKDPRTHTRRVQSHSENIASRIPLVRKPARTSERKYPYRQPGEKAYPSSPETPSRKLPEPKVVVTTEMRPQPAAKTAKDQSSPRQTRTPLKNVYMRTTDRKTSPPGCTAAKAAKQSVKGSAEPAAKTQKSTVKRAKVEMTSKEYSQKVWEALVGDDNEMKCSKTQATQSKSVKKPSSASKETGAKISKSGPKGSTKKDTTSEAGPSGIQDTPEKTMVTSKDAPSEPMASPKGEKVPSAKSTNRESAKSPQPLKEVKTPAKGPPDQSTEDNKEKSSLNAPQKGANAPKAGPSEGQTAKLVPTKIPQPIQDTAVKLGTTALSAKRTDRQTTDKAPTKIPQPSKDTVVGRKTPMIGTTALLPCDSEKQASIKETAPSPTKVPQPSEDTAVNAKRPIFYIGTTALSADEKDELKTDRASVKPIPPPPPPPLPATKIPLPYTPVTRKTPVMGTNALSPRRTDKSQGVQTLPASKKTLHSAKDPADRPRTPLKESAGQTTGSSRVQTKPASRKTAGPSDTQTTGEPAETDDSEPKLPYGWVSSGIKKYTDEEKARLDAEVDGYWGRKFSKDRKKPWWNIEDPEEREAARLRRRSKTDLQRTESSNEPPGATPSNYKQPGIEIQASNDVDSSSVILPSLFGTSTGVRSRAGRSNVGLVPKKLEMHFFDSSEDSEDEVDLDKPISVEDLHDDDYWRAIEKKAYAMVKADTEQLETVDESPELEKSAQEAMPRRAEMRETDNATVKETAPSQTKIPQPSQDTSVKRETPVICTTALSQRGTEMQPTDKAFVKEMECSKTQATPSKDAKKPSSASKDTGVKMSKSGPEGSTKKDTPSEVKGLHEDGPSGYQDTPEKILVTFEDAPSEPMASPKEENALSAKSANMESAESPPPLKEVKTPANGPPHPDQSTEDNKEKPSLKAPQKGANAPKVGPSGDQTATLVPTKIPQPIRDTAVKRKDHMMGTTALAAKRTDRQTTDKASTKIPPPSKDTDVKRKTPMMGKTALSPIQTEIQATDKAPIKETPPLPTKIPQPPKDTAVKRPIFYIGETALSADEIDVQKTDRASVKPIPPPPPPPLPPTKIPLPYTPVTRKTPVMGKNVLTPRRTDKSQRVQTEPASKKTLQSAKVSADRSRTSLKVAAGQTTRPSRVQTKPASRKTAGPSDTQTTGEPAETDDSEPKLPYGWVSSGIKKYTDEEKARLDAEVDGYWGRKFSKDRKKPWWNIEDPEEREAARLRRRSRTDLQRTESSNEPPGATPSNYKQPGIEIQASNDVDSSSVILPSLFGTSTGVRSRAGRSNVGLVPKKLEMHFFDSSEDSEDEVDLDKPISVEDLHDDDYWRAIEKKAYAMVKADTEQLETVDESPELEKSAQEAMPRRAEMRETDNATVKETAPSQTKIPQPSQDTSVKRETPVICTTALSQRGTEMQPTDKAFVKEMECSKTQATPSKDAKKPSSASKDTGVKMSKSGPEGSTKKDTPSEVKGPHEDGPSGYQDTPEKILVTFEDAPSEPMASPKEENALSAKSANMESAESPPPLKEVKTPANGPPHPDQSTEDNKEKPSLKAPQKGANAPKVGPSGDQTATLVPTKIPQPIRDTAVKRKDHMMGTTALAAKRTDRQTTDKASTKIPPPSKDTDVKRKTPMMGKTALSPIQTEIQATDKAPIKETPPLPTKIPQPSKDTAVKRPIFYIGETALSADEIDVQKTDRASVKPIPPPPPPPLPPTKIPLPYTPVTRKTPVMGKNVLTPRRTDKSQRVQTEPASKKTLQSAKVSADRSRTSLKVAAGQTTRPSRVQTKPASRKTAGPSDTQTTGEPAETDDSEPKLPYGWVSSGIKKYTVEERARLDAEVDGYWGRKFSKDRKKPWWNIEDPEEREAARLRQRSKADLRRTESSNEPPGATPTSYKHPGIDNQVTCDVDGSSVILPSLFRTSTGVRSRASRSNVGLVPKKLEMHFFDSSEDSEDEIDLDKPISVEDLHDDDYWRAMEKKAYAMVKENAEQLETVYESPELENSAQEATPRRTEMQETDNASVKETAPPPTKIPQLSQDTAVKRETPVICTTALSQRSTVMKPKDKAFVKEMECSKTQATPSKDAKKPSSASKDAGAKISESGPEGSTKTDTPSDVKGPHEDGPSGSQDTPEILVTFEDAPMASPKGENTPNATLTNMESAKSPPPVKEVKTPAKGPTDQSTEGNKQKPSLKAPQEGADGSKAGPSGDQTAKLVPTKIPRPIQDTAVKREDPMMGTPTLSSRRTNMQSKDKAPTKIPQPSKDKDVKGNTPVMCATALSPRQTEIQATEKKAYPLVKANMDQLETVDEPSELEKPAQAATPTAKKPSKVRQLLQSWDNKEKKREREARERAMKEKEGKKAYTVEHKSDPPNAKPFIGPPLPPGMQKKTLEKKKQGLTRRGHQGIPTLAAIRAKEGKPSTFTKSDCRLTPTKLVGKTN